MRAARAGRGPHGSRAPRALAAGHGARPCLAGPAGAPAAPAAAPAPVLTLAISDVPGDDPSTIGSGPTVPDPTTLEQARAWLADGPTIPREQAQALAASLAWRGISDFPRGTSTKN